jgi:antitoxin MazE
VNNSAAEGLAYQGTRVFKAGNSLAVRIPSALAKRVALEDGSAVEIAADDATIYVRTPPARALTDLIEAITPDNVHAPVFESPIGAEWW